jgi:hypothetical protein
MDIRAPIAYDENLNNLEDLLVRRVPHKDRYDAPAGGGELGLMVFNRFKPFYALKPAYDYDETYSDCDCSECEENSQPPSPGHHGFRRAGMENTIMTCPECIHLNISCPYHQVTLTVAQYAELVDQGPKPNRPPNILFP